MLSALQRTLSKWSFQHAIPFFITDFEGNPIVQDPEWPPLIHPFKTQMKHLISYMGQTLEPVLVECKLDDLEGQPIYFKAMMWSLFSRTSKEFILWSGWFSDHKLPIEGLDIKEVPFLSPMEKKGLFDAMEACADECLSVIAEKKHNSEQSDLIQFLFEHSFLITSKQDLVEKASKQFPYMHIVGIALWEDHLLQVNYCSEQALIQKNLTFMSGEGYIGKVFASGREEYWEIEEADPRSHVFLENDLPIKQFIGFPILFETNRLGVLWFGSYGTESRLVDQYEEFGNQWAALLGICIHLAKLKNQEQIHSFQLSALMEMVRNYDQLKTSHEVANFLLDIATTVLQIKRCLIYYPSNTLDEENILEGRGFGVDDFNLYSIDLIHRLKGYQEKPNRDPVITHTVINEKMVEYVLWNEARDQAGVIAFSYDHPVGGDFFYSYLKLIGTVTNEAFNRINRQATVLDRTDLLFESIHFSNPNLYKEMKESLEILSFLAAREGVQSIVESSRLTGLLKLSAFPVEWVQKMGLNHQAIQDLRELKKIQSLKDLSTDSFAVCIVYATMEYVKTEAKMGLILDLKKLTNEKNRLKWILEGLEAWKVHKTNESGNPAVTTPIFHQNILAQLTDRELEVLDMLAHGLKNHDISRILYISQNTVKNHISNLYKKLQIKNRSQATSFFLNYHARFKKVTHNN